MASRLVVLASGGGTNCQAVIDACAAGVLDAQVVAIITNNPDAGVVERATLSGIACHHIVHRGKDPATRAEADQRLIELIGSCEPDLVILAGWMRILGAAVGAAFPIINLHPALPGQFAGVRAIERAYDAWTRDEITESGVMVHWVPDEGVDVGPVIATEVVEIAPDDELADFAERMHAAEHRVIVAATAKALESRS